MSCIFYRIVKGEVPSLKVYEDEHTLVFMDTWPRLDGAKCDVKQIHHALKLQ